MLNAHLKNIQTIMLQYKRKTVGNHVGGGIFIARNFGFERNSWTWQKLWAVIYYELWALITSELITYLKRSLVTKWERPGLAHSMAPTHWTYLHEAMCACDAVTTMSHERMAVTRSSVWESCVEHSRYNSSTTESTPLLSPSGRNKQLFRRILNFLLPCLWKTEGSFMVLSTFNSRLSVMWLGGAASILAPNEKINLEIGFNDVIFSGW